MSHIPYYSHLGGAVGPPPPLPEGYTYMPVPTCMPVLPPYSPSQHPMAHHYPLPPRAPEPTHQPTYVTNYIYQQTPQPEPVAAVEEVLDWVPATPTTAGQLAHRAFVAGKEGWDGSPLWVIRAYFNGDLVPGKLAIKHQAAYIPYGGKEVSVHSFEVLCAPQHTLRWVPASKGQVPLGAIPAGNTQSAEPLYIALCGHMRSTTPGKVHPSHGTAYISFGGSEHPYSSYKVLCKIMG